MVNDSAVKPINYNWAINTIKKIREFTNDEIIFRDHPLQKDIYRIENEKILNIKNVYLSSNINIENDLHKSRCCVTFSSGSAIESLFLNIPVIAMDKRSFVYEIVENKIDMIEHLSVPDLKSLKSAISFTHYSISEIYKIIKSYIFDNKSTNILILEDSYFSELPFKDKREKIDIEKIKNEFKEKNFDIIYTLSDFKKINKKYDLIINIFFSSKTVNQISFTNKILDLSLIRRNTFLFYLLLDL